MKPGIALVCGVPVEDVTLDEAAQRVCELVERGRAGGRTHQVVTVNVDFLVNALADPRLRRILQHADLAIPDGMPVVWGSRLLGAPLRERVAGSDLVPELAERSAREGYSMFLLGGAPGVAHRAAEMLRRRAVGLEVAAESGGRVGAPEDMDPGVLDRIREARPDILCVALGHPKQEEWIEAHRPRLHVPVMIGVGASLDFLVGVQRRAPRWMQRTGTEWLYRALSDPARLAPRYARDFVRFGPQLVREAVLSRPHVAPDVVTAVVEHRGRITLVRPTGRRLLLDAIALGWGDSAGSEPPVGHQVVVDLSERTYLDPEELAALVVLAKRLAARGGALTLSSVAEPVMRRLLDRRLYGFLHTSSHASTITDATAHLAAPSLDDWLPHGLRAPSQERQTTHA